MKKHRGKPNRPKISYPPHPPLPPFNTIPIIEVPDTPQEPQLYTIEELEDEKEKLYSMHVELCIKHEDRIRYTILYLVDRIGWPSFNLELSKLIEIWNEMLNNEASLRPILDKWSSREDIITTLCCHVIIFSNEQVERTFDKVNDLSEFDKKRNILQRKINICFIKYLGYFFYFFPHVIKSRGQIRENEEWAKELNELISSRLNATMNDEKYIWFARTIEELVQVELFFESFKQDFHEIRKIGTSVLSKEHVILNFNWPDDIIFDKWVVDYSPTI